MTRINTIDRATHRLVCKRIEAALKELGDELGLRLTCGGGQYAFDGESVFRVKALIEAPDGTVEPQEAKDFKRFAPAIGLSPDDLGRQFFHQGKLYKITGFRPNATKNNITVQRLPDRKGFVVPHAIVKANLSARAA